MEQFQNTQAKQTPAISAVLLKAYSSMLFTFSNKDNEIYRNPNKLFQVKLRILPFLAHHQANSWSTQTSKTNA